MRVNSRVFEERRDMLDGIRVPNCPSQFKVVAENIMNMVTAPGYAIGDYHTMTELDKILMADYWLDFDSPPVITSYTAWADWFTAKATSPELIRRARQWLVEHNYLILKSDVAERAYEAGNKFRSSIKR